jgi:hypothetical protein
MVVVKIAFRWQGVIFVTTTYAALLFPEAFF